MNWLILTNDKNTAKQFEDIILLREKTANISLFSLQKKDTKKWSLQLNDISNVIIAGDESEIEKTEISGPLMALSGYCIAEKITLFTNLKSIDNLSIGAKDQVYFFKSTQKIIDELNSNYIYLSDAYKKRVASKSLFDEGIPFTPTCFAEYITEGKFEICRQFLSAGMDINVRDKDGTPMINIAVRTDNEEIVSWLIDNGADINTASEDRGYTPLMDAIWRGNYDVAKCLIKQGADVNTISKEGQTNLILAVGASKADLVELLANNKADPDIKDQMGMSAYGYAKLFKKDDIVKILEPFHKE